MDYCGHMFNNMQIKKSINFIRLILTFFMLSHLFANIWVFIG